MAYFIRLDNSQFLPTEHTGGAWNVQEQHIAPSIGLLTHVIERECASRDNGFIIGRLSFDILGTLPIEAVETEVHLARAGRTIELVEATLLHNRRPALRARAWLMKPTDTGALAGSSVPPLPSPQQMPAWNPTAVWPGAFIESLEIRRVQEQPGRARYWARAQHALLDNEPVSALASLAGLFDIANGMAVRADPQTVAFPNLDLTAHLFATPRGEWLGFDTTVSFGKNGIGLTNSLLFDQDGPLGSLAQILTIRPAAGR